MPPVPYLEAGLHGTASASAPATATGRCRPSEDSDHRQTRLEPVYGHPRLKTAAPPPSVDTRHYGHHLDETTLLRRLRRCSHVIGPCIAGLDRTRGRSHVKDLTSRWHRRRRRRVLAAPPLSSAWDASTGRAPFVFRRPANLQSGNCDDDCCRRHRRHPLTLG